MPCPCKTCRTPADQPVSCPYPPSSRIELVQDFGDAANDALFEPRHIVPVPILTAGGFPHTVFCHRAIAPKIAAIFAALRGQGHESLVRSYDGCFVHRDTRGVPHLSIHAWGLAIDLNAYEFPLGSTKRQDPILIRAFAAYGFFYGGNFKHRLDPMHWEYTHAGL